MRSDWGGSLIFLLLTSDNHIELITHSEPIFHLQLYFKRATASQYSTTNRLQLPVSFVFLKASSKMKF